MKLSFTLFLTAVFFVGVNFAQENPGQINKLTDENITHTYLNCNHISTIFYNDGMSDVIRSNGGQAGFEYPKGSGKTAVYKSGLLWGAFVEGDSQFRTSGSAFRTSMKPGKILPDGTPDDPSLPKNRIYRVRSDVYPGGPQVVLSNEIADENDSYENIWNKYEKDWNEWPAEEGAPFIDINANGIYEPLIDVPGIENAKQTIWYVANGLDEGANQAAFYTSTLGIEMQVTIWAYDNDPILSNAIFRKYKLINKSLNDMQEMYIASMLDADIGDGENDFIGTDTLNNMVYGYNGEVSDNVYNTVAPPAVGYQLLQGPIVEGQQWEDRNKNGIDDASDFAFYENKLKGPGFINLPMTASFATALGKFGFDPDWEIGDVIDWWYYNFQGAYNYNRDTGNNESFLNSGYPETQTGWLDGIVFPPGDRMVGFSIGPINFAIEDTQEVVVAQIAAQSTDRFKSIELLRNYASRIQDDYASQNLTKQTPAPPTPQIKVTETAEGILIEWDENENLISEIENFNSDGYKFQGYNIYSRKNHPTSFEENIKIASFDIKDGITNISGEIRDPVTGFPVNGIIHHGNDTGIERSFFIDKDLFDGSALIKGKEYPIGISAYTYNENPANSVSSTESSIIFHNIRYLSDAPSVNYGDNITYYQSAGTGDDGAVTIKVADPEQLTGDDYEVFFSIVNYFRGEDAEWHPFAKIGDLTYSSLSGAAIYGDTANSIDIKFEVHNNSHNGAWIDGIIINFPVGSNIISAPEFEAGGGIVTPQINGRQINLGLVNDEHTQNGIFHGGEIFNVLIDKINFPFEIEYTLKDDGWQNIPVDVVDTVEINEIGYAYKTEKYWNLRNVSSNDTVLFNQTVMDGIDIYTNEFIGNPVADGLELNVDVQYEGSNTFSKLLLNSSVLERGFDQNRYSLIPERSCDDCRFLISDYTDFEIPWAIALNSQLGYGTTDSTLLAKDYELHFTGVLKTDSINGKLVEYVESGGQMATLYGARSYDIADHPLNPDPGSSEPFLIRIPFEVWSIDDDKQINFMVYDRHGRVDWDIPFEVWNKDGRMYTDFVMSNYQESVIDPVGTVVENYATWNLVWYKNNWEMGDEIQVLYRSPITPEDKFRFTAPQPFNKKEYATPASFQLLQNFPNPFNPTTTIRFDLPEDNIVKLEIFNILGQRVSSIINNEFYEGGTYDVQFNGRGLSSGVYFYRIEFGSYFDVKKMLLVK